MNVEEVRSIIVESKAYLEDYKAYGKMVQDTIDALSTVENLVSNLETDKLKEALKIVTNLKKQLEVYRDYVPTLAMNIDKIHNWLLSKVE